MGGLIVGGGELAAYIGVNLNGGAGSYQPAFTVSPTSPHLNWFLNRAADNSFYFAQNSEGATLVLPSVPTADVATYFDGNWTVFASPDQADYADRVATLLNVASPTYTSATVAENNQKPFSATDWLKAKLGSVLDPVNTITGEFYIDATDLTVPGVTPLKVRRNYLSQNRSKGEFGVGWKLSYTPRLVVVTNSDQSVFIYATEPEGSVIAYRKTNDLYLPTVQDNRTLNNDSINGIGSVANMFNARITRLFTNSAEIYTQTGPDGSVRTFETRSYPIVATNLTL